MRFAPELPPRIVCPDCGSRDLRATEHEASTHRGPLTWATWHCEACGAGPFDDVEDLPTRGAWVESVRLGEITDPSGEILPWDEEDRSGEIVLADYEDPWPDEAA